MSVGHGPYGTGDYGAGLYGSDESAEFPAGPLRESTEILIDGAWVYLTPLALARDSVAITHGQSDEGSSVDFAKMSFSLNNRDGAFSPRNPLSPYYGLLGRNTQVRHSVSYGPCRLVNASGVANGVSTADSAALDIVGDIDVRVDASNRSWYLTGDLAFKYGAAGQRSWYFHVVAGVLRFTWSADGTALLTSDSTVPVAWPATGRVALRVTLDVDNGAAGNTTTFWYADTIDAANGWTQLGDTVVKAGTTSIFASTAGLSVGLPLEHQVYAAQVLNGIGGSAASSADFRTAGDGDTSFVASTGETWAFGGGVSASNRHYRFWGEISALPVRWDTTGRDVWVPVNASGLIRRLGTRTAVLQSVLYRGITTTTDTTVIGYWPCEDAANSTSIAAAIGGRPMTFTGTPEFASNSNYAASAPLPTLANSKWTFPVSGYDSSGAQFEVRFLLSSGAAFTTNAVIARIVTTGTAGVWELRYTTGGAGSLNLVALSNDGTTTIGSTGATVEALDGKDWVVVIQAVQSGADINASYAIYQIGAGGYTSNSFVALASTVGAVKYGQIDPNGNIDQAAVGHLYVGSVAITPVFATSLFDQALAYDGRESAAGRVNRLCDEEAVSLTLLGFSQVGINDGSQVMGPQTQKTLLDLLRDAAAADLGVLYESTSEVGLVYRPRLAGYNRLAAATLSYPAVHLAALDQVDDDQNVRNDVTVSRFGGSSHRETQTSGPLNVNDPADDPQGVGRYPDTPTVVVDVDSILPDQAAWRLRAGTVDEARYPTVGVNLANQALGPSVNAVLELLELREGDRLVITGTRPDGAVDNISLTVLGWSETMNQNRWTIEFNCAPDAATRVAVYSLARYSSDGSTLGESLTTATTSFQVATPGGPLWGHGDGDFDIAVNGERMTVTAVSGSSSPQTFTATRAVNGISRGHTSGDAVALWTPAYYAL